MEKIARTDNPGLNIVPDWRALAEAEGDVDPDPSKKSSLLKFVHRLHPVLRQGRVQVDDVRHDGGTDDSDNQQQ